MTTPLQTPTTGPVEAVPEAAGEAEAVSRFPSQILLIVLVILLIFGGTYAFAWYNANQLATRFMKDADASYDSGKYLEALVGTQEFDPQTNQYVKHGGYLDVEKIWSGSYSWPYPSSLQKARQRGQEIINQRLTVADAEQYIQANIGKPAPYFGEIYLRLGELYQQEGDTADALDVYKSMADLFPNRPDLIQQAQKHLAQLESK